MNIRTQRAPRALRAVLAGTALALAVAACGDATVVGQDSGSSSGGATVSAPPQPPEFSKVATPGPPLGDTSALRGKTVYWIPITSVAPVFSVEQKAATEAFAAIGMKLQLCDGQATPDVVGRCVGQAVAADAAGIIVTSIPPEFARQAFDGAVAADIPLLFVNTKDGETPPEWGEVAAAMPNNWAEQAKLNNQLITADSGGNAKVLLVGVTDSSATTDLFEQGMQADLREQCPGCEIETVPTSSTQISNLPSLVSSALVQNPDTEYVFVQYDSFAAPVVQAIRQLNKQNSVKLLTLLGQLDGMQRLADGSAFADTGYSLSALGWNEADVLMRMMLGQDPLIEAHVTPIMTHTPSTLQGLDLTQAGWESGRWQSDDDFRAMYRELWSAS